MTDPTAITRHNVMAHDLGGRGDTLTQYEVAAGSGAADWQIPVGALMAEWESA